MTGHVMIDVLSEAKATKSTENSERAAYFTGLNVLNLLEASVWFVLITDSHPENMVATALRAAVRSLRCSTFSTYCTVLYCTSTYQPQNKCDR